MTETSTEPSGLRGRDLRLLWAMAAVNLVDNVDQNILRGVLPLLEDDFGLSDFQLGSLGFAFVFVNALIMVPAGWIADRYHRLRIIGFTLISWSALSGAAALARNFPQLFLARAALGFGQALDEPASTALLADSYPSEVRGRVFAVQQLTLFLGAGLGLGLGGAIGESLGWRWAFVLVGMPGSLLALWMFRLREPARGEADGALATSMEPTERPPDGFIDFVRAATAGVIADLRMLFGIRTMRYILIGVGALLFSISGIGFWTAVYHERYSGLTVTESTAYTALMLAIAGITGTIWGGQRADREGSLSPASRIVLVSNCLFAGGVFFAASVTVPWIAARFVIQGLGVVAFSMAIPALRASMMDVIPIEQRGISTSAFGLVSTIFGSALAPPAVGLLSDVTGSLVVAFYVVTPPVLIGALILRRARHTAAQDALVILHGIEARNARLVEQPDES